MSKLMEQAVALLEETSRKFGKLTDELSENIQNEDFDKVNLAYKIAATLDIYASQLSGEEKSVEGLCEVDNACAKVVVNGVSLRDQMQFDLLLDQEWTSGHRENSQYGQVFHAKEKGTHILTDQDQGRVTFPLKMDGEEA